MQLLADIGDGLLQALLGEERKLASSVKREYTLSGLGTKIPFTARKISLKIGVQSPLLLNC